MLPNLIIPGAQKSASTTLSILLAEHQEVYRGTRKEPHYFSIDALYEQGPAYYRHNFYPEYGGQRYVLDASQSYLPLSFVPKRIHNDLGTEVKFIVVLRNPVDRMESAFKHFRELPERDVARDMREIVPAKLDGLSLEELIEYEDRTVRAALEEGRLVGRNPTWTRHNFPYNYAFVGCYSTHLANYFEYFPRENLLFLTFEEVTQRQADATRRVADFLDLRPETLQPARPVHSSRIKLYKSETVGSMMRTLKKRIKPLVPTTLKRQLVEVERAHLLRHDVYKFEPCVYNQLVEIFEPEIDRTSELTGLDLSAWKQTRPQQQTAD